jgi:hypothetical protein
MGLLCSAFRSGFPIPDDPELSALCRDLVAGNDRLTPAEQVDIYRRQYWLRHIDSLGEDYPGLAFVLGEDDFDAFCRAYLAACPPSSFTLRDLGDRIVQFAHAYEQFVPEKKALALDMVRYENAFIDLFDGASPPPLDPAKVTGMPPEGWNTARIVLHPLLVLLRLSHPVHTLRSTLGPGKTPELPRPRPVHVALFCTDLVIRYEELDPSAFALLDALARGVPLVPACEVLAAELGEDEAERAALASRVQAWFVEWTRWGLIADVKPG